MHEGAPHLLSLSALLGRAVATPSGRRIPRVRDLIVDLSVSPVTVTAVVVGDRQGRWRVPAWQVRLTPSRSLLVDGEASAPFEVQRGLPHLSAHELMLARDVLDTRVYDVPGRGTVRVGDVWLEQDSRDRLVVAGLEVGARVVLRRLGRRSHRRSTGTVGLLSLSEVHLTSPRGHQVQLATPTSSVHDLDATELAHLLTHLPMSSAADVVRELPDEVVAGAAGHLHPHVLRRLRHVLGGDEPAIPRRIARTAGWRLNRPRPRGAGRGEHPPPPLRGGPRP